MKAMQKDCFYLLENGVVQISFKGKFIRLGKLKKLADDNWDLGNPYPKDKSWYFEIVEILPPEEGRAPKDLGLRTILIPTNKMSAEEALAEAGAIALDIMAVQSSLQVGAWGEEYTHLFQDVPKKYVDLPLTSYFISEPVRGTAKF